MTLWQQWNRSSLRDLAYFVNPGAAERTGLKPNNANDLLEDENIRALVEAIYEEVRQLRLGFDPEAFSGDTPAGSADGMQAIKQPHSFRSAGSANCLDLSVLVAGICLACQVLPLLVIVRIGHDRHALVAVSTRTKVRNRPLYLAVIGDEGVRDSSSTQRADPVENVRAWLKSDDWITIETVGACQTTRWDPEGKTRRSIAFEDSVAAARDLLDRAQQISVVDVEWLRRERSFIPHQTDEQVRCSHRRRWVSLASTVAVLLIVAATAFVWLTSPGRASMTGDFSIAFGALDGGGSVSDRDMSAIPRELARQLAATYPTEAGYEIWGPERVGIVPLDAASKLADHLEADVLVYGEMTLNPIDEDLYDVDLHVNTAYHSARAPWPLQLDESISFTVAVATVTGNVSESVARIRVLTHVLAALAAILADALDSAVLELEAARSLADDDGPALVPALLAWTMLAKAGYDGDLNAVKNAAEVADVALDLDRSSEFARIVRLSADYLLIVPPRPSIAVAGCVAGGSGVSADLDDFVPASADVVAMRESIEGQIHEMSIVGQVQLTALLGRLAVAEVLLGNKPVAIARDHFESNVDRARGHPSLNIWLSDAHLWLGRLALAEGATDAAIAHFVSAADVATPVWKARAYGLAGYVLLCETVGSDEDAACFFVLAASVASGAGSDADADLFEAATEGLECPGGWTINQQWTREAT